MTKTPPLQGQCICITRAPHQSAALRHQLQSLGATCVHVPTMHIKPLPCHIDPPPPNHSIYAIFTSSNAVPSAAAALQKLDRETINLAVGPATADTLTQHQLHPDHIAPVPYGSDALMRMPLWSSLAPTHSHIMVFTGQDCSHKLRQSLQQRHFQPHMHTCYQRSCPNTTIEHLLNPAQCQQITTIVSTSSDLLDNLWHMTPPTVHTWLQQTPLLVISPTMTQQAKELGFTRIFEAANASTSAILARLIQGAQNLPH
jgi:uroporphyrinogen-III synthase